MMPVREQRLLETLREKDDKAAVRQCLKVLHEVALYRSELCETIESGILQIIPESFSESMASLIKKILQR